MRKTLLAPSETAALGSPRRACSSCSSAAAEVGRAAHARGPKRAKKRAWGKRVGNPARVTGTASMRPEQRSWCSSECGSTSAGCFEAFGSAGVTGGVRGRGRGMGRGRVRAAAY